MVHSTVPIRIYIPRFWVRILHLREALLTGSWTRFLKYRSLSSHRRFTKFGLFLAFIWLFKMRIFTSESSNKLELFTWLYDLKSFLCNRSSRNHVNNFHILQLVNVSGTFQSKFLCENKKISFCLTMTALILVSIIPYITIAEACLCIICSIFGQSLFMNLWLLRLCWNKWNWFYWMWKYYPSMYDIDLFSIKLNISIETIKQVQHYIIHRLWSMMEIAMERYISSMVKT